ncbi:MAG: hypothetical protein ACHREM_02310 [Polyangiales bacterium]
MTARCPVCEQTYEDGWTRHTFLLEHDRARLAGAQGCVMLFGENSGAAFPRAELTARLQPHVAELAKLERGLYRLCPHCDRLAGLQPGPPPSASPSTIPSEPRP